MNTLQRQELERLERMYGGRDSSIDTKPGLDNALNPGSLFKIRLLCLAAIALAIFSYFNPGQHGQLISAFLGGALAFLYFLVKRYELRLCHRAGLRAWLPERKTMKVVGALALFATGYLAASTAQQVEKLRKADDPLLLTSWQDSHNPNATDLNRDTRLGTTEVGDKLPGLSLEKSLITGHVDADSLTSALYWNITFNNSKEFPQEARARLVLPEGGVVSRATLWVNGVPQEAAFDATSKVQGAYQWIVQRGRDPLLITQTEPGEVFVQAFPVPAHGKMQLRIGITAPLQANSTTDFEVIAPHIVSSNFQVENLVSTVKLESNAKIDCTLEGERVKERHSKSILAMDLKSGDEEDAVFRIHREKPFKMFAARATHCNDKSFIVERLVESNLGRMEISRLKTTTMPSVDVAYDFPSASRVSTLWALDEVKRCLDLGEIDKAGELGSVYRIVTGATGATVLENEYDYLSNGLDRNFYRVISPSDASSGMNANANVAAPILQGATNGTIGPQSVDPTSVMGVNTAGTVRVNNFVTLECLLNQCCIGLSGLFFAAAAFFLGKSCFGPALAKSKNMILGTAFLMVAITTSFVIQWLLNELRTACIFT